MRLSNKVVSGALAIALVAPMLTQATTLTATQKTALENLLNSFGVASTTIARVEAVIANEQKWGSASSTPGRLPPGQIAKAACIELRRNLGPGSSGDDVKKLQDLLREDDLAGFTAASTGFFGPMTMRAMARYQEKHGIASTTTGHVGPLTRAFLHRSCGKGLREKNPDDDRVGSSTPHRKNPGSSLNSGPGKNTDDDSDDEEDDE